MRLNSISFAALLTLAVDCKSGDLVSPTDGMLRTDRSEYILTRESNTIRVDIGVTFDNRTGKAVYIPACHGAHPPILEKFEGGRWIVAYAPAVLLCLGPPVVVPAGETYEYEYRVVAGAPGTNIEPKFDVDAIPGTYRLVWGLFEEKLPDGLTRQPLPAESRTSNTFRIREP